jgi:hypothetical protein
MNIGRWHIGKVSREIAFGCGYIGDFFDISTFVLDL